MTSKTPPMKRDYTDLLKQHDLSLTSVRLAVLDALDTHPHADAEQVYTIVKDKIATTSKQAIYNNLNILVECGIIREIKPKGKSSLYETRVGDNHHHLVCRVCHIVMDADCHGRAPCLHPINDHGFKIDEAEVIYWGVCPDCQKKK